MNTTSIIAIIIISIAAVVVVLTLMYVGFAVSNNNAQTEYCEKWAATLEQRKAQLESVLAEYNNAGFWKSLDFDREQFNIQMNELQKEANEYNKECYY